MFKAKWGLCPDHIIRLFPKSSNKYSLRNNEFVTPRVNTTGYGKHSRIYLGAVLWYKLDHKLKQPEETLVHFETLIRIQDLAKLFFKDFSSICILCNS